MLGGLFTKIMGFLVIIITLALAPTINTANALIVSANLTNLIGMSVVAGFAAPLIVLGLLTSGGIFAVGGLKGNIQGASIQTMLGVVGSVIVVIVALTFMVDIIGYTNTLIAASSGFAETLYGVIPLVIYLGVIAGAGWYQVSAYRKLRKGRRASRGLGY